MNWFRVPMNIITCAALLCLHVDWISYDKRLVFGACLVLCAMGLYSTNKLLSLPSNGGEKDSSETKEGMLLSKENPAMSVEEVKKQKLIEN